MGPRHMTKPEREAFLEGVHIAVISIANGDGAPVVSPVWYHYRAGGDIYISIERTGQKAQALHDGKVVSICVQNEHPPYGYAVVEGPVHLETIDYERDVAAVARRYLGAAGAEQYLSQQPQEEAIAQNVLVRIRPHIWKTVDFG